MNNNSYICNFISQHPEDWEHILFKQYELRIKKDGDYAIFNYNVTCNFADPIVQEARGIIIDISTLDVVCWPFRKFGNYTESYADEIDWDSARVLEKVDGSIIKLWFDRKASKWQFSTNGTIRAENANIDNCIGLTFGELIARAENYGDIPFNTLDKDTTYIFELVSPENRVIIKYPKASLYHIGTRSNLTGIERDEDIGIKKPISYPLTTLDDCIKAALALNNTSTEEEEIVGEGFVVVDKYWRRVKIKSLDYINQHKLILTKAISKFTIIEMLLRNDKHIPALTENNPHLIPYFKYYDYKISELKFQADQIATLSRNLYQEYGNDKKALAKIISNHRLAIVGFRAVTNTLSGSEILLGLDIDKFIKYIPDYEPEDIRNLFATK